MTSTLLLRRVLGLDAASCAAMGTLLAVGAGVLEPLLGLSESLLRGAGLFLLALSALLAWMASRPVPPSPLVWLVIIGNLLWGLESFALLATQVGITGLGTAFVAIQAVAVLGLAVLEWVGMRRAHPLRAHA